MAILTLTLPDGPVVPVRSIRDSKFAHADGACPLCGDSEPFQIMGRGTTVEQGSHDTYRADGACADCGHYVGVIRAQVDTLFGVQDDQDLYAYCAARGIRVGIIP